MDEVDEDQDVLLGTYNELLRQLIKLEKARNKALDSLYEYDKDLSMLSQRSSLSTMTKNISQISARSCGRITMTTWLYANPTIL